MTKAGAKAKPVEDREKVIVGKAARPIVGEVVKAAAPRKPVKVEVVARNIITVAFGGVTLDVTAPTPTEARKRLTESRAVAKKFSEVISRPGIRLSHKRTTPTYTVDSKDPRFVVQKLGNKTTKGLFKHGVFVPA